MVRLQRVIVDWVLDQVEQLGRLVLHEPPGHNRRKPCPGNC